MNLSGPQLNYAVLALIPEIEARLLTRPVKERSEGALWVELSLCVLSSRVPYELARAATSRLEALGLLLPSNSCMRAPLESALYRALSEPLTIHNSSRRYRFPRLRARQLALGMQGVRSEYGSLQQLLGSEIDAKLLRHSLVERLPGIGPKQASMFLRNVGASCDLAVIDSHVIAYLSALGFGIVRATLLSSLSAYEAHEALLAGLAEELGCQLGVLDWAIWITMREAAKLRQE